MKQHSTHLSSWKTTIGKLAASTIAAAAALLLVPQGVFAQPALGCTSSIDSQIMLKEEASLDVSLENTGSAVGFIPGVAIPLPEGLTITGATSNALGATVESENLDGSGNGVHPFTRRPVTGPASGTYFFVRPGISSLAPSADPIEFTITVDTTDDVEIKTPITVDAECQFEFGTNALGTDTPIVLVDAFTTEVVVLKVAYVVKGKEGAPATPTGPSWLVIWTGTVNIAEGITINSFNLDHEVTDNFLVTGVNVLNGPVTAGSPSGIPGGTIASTVGSITGTPTCQRDRNRVCRVRSGVSRRWNDAGARSAHRRKKQCARRNPRHQYRRRYPGHRGLPRRFALAPAELGELHALRSAQWLFLSSHGHRHVDAQSMRVRLLLLHGCQGGFHGSRRDGLRQQLAFSGRDRPRNDRGNGFR